LFFFASRRRHTRSDRDWSSDVCSSDLFVTAVRLLALQKMTADLSDVTNPIAVAEIIVDHLAVMLPNARPLVALLSADNEYVEYIDRKGGR